LTQEGPLPQDCQWCGVSLPLSCTETSMCFFIVSIVIMSKFWFHHFSRTVILSFQKITCVLQQLAYEHWMCNGCHRWILLHWWTRDGPMRPGTGTRDCTWRVPAVLRLLHNFWRTFLETWLRPIRLPRRVFTGNLTAEEGSSPATWPRPTWSCSSHWAGGLGTGTTWFLPKSGQQVPHLAPLAGGYHKG
jgi:hypothetical protein